MPCPSKAREMLHAGGFMMSSRLWCWRCTVCGKHCWRASRAQKAVRCRASSRHLSVQDPCWLHDVWCCKIQACCFPYITMQLWVARFDANCSKGGKNWFTNETIAGTTKCCQSLRGLAWLFSRHIQGVGHTMQFFRAMSKRPPVFGGAHRWR